MNKGQNKSIQPRRNFKEINHFQNLLSKSPIVSDSSIEKVIEHGTETKAGPFNELELDEVLKTVKNKKAAKKEKDQMEFHPKSGKQENLMTFFYIIVIKYTMEMQINLGLKDVYCPFQRKVILVRPVIKEG